MPPASPCSAEEAFTHITKEALASTHLPLGSLDSPHIGQQKQYKPPKQLSTVTDYCAAQAEKTSSDGIESQHTLLHMGLSRYFAQTLVHWDAS